MPPLINTFLAWLSTASDKTRRWALTFAGKIPLPIIRSGTALYIKRQQKALNHVKYPGYLYFFITRQCNLRCRHCFYINQLSGVRNDLSLDAIASLAASSRGHLKSVSLTGGEPFVKRDLFPIIALFAESGCTSINIATNGTFVGPATEGLLPILARYPKTHFALQISLDGPEHIHDPIRGVPGTFTKAWQTMRFWSSLSPCPPNFTLYTNTVVSRLNAQEFPDFYRLLQTQPRVTPMWHFLRQDALDVHGIAAEHLLDSTPGDNLLPDITTCHAIIEAAYPAQDPLSQWRKLEKYYHLEIALQGQRPFHCVEPHTGMVLFNDGWVSVCEVLKPVVNIQSYQNDLIRTFQSPEMTAQRRLASTCYCTYPCALMRSMLYSPRPIMNAFQAAKEGKRA